MKRNAFFFSTVLILIVMAAPLFLIRASAAVPTAYYYAVRRFRTAELPNGTGLAYDDVTGTLLALSTADTGRSLRVEEFDRVMEDALGESEAAVSASDPRSIAFDSESRTLIVYGASGGTATAMARSANQPGTGWQPAGSQRFGGNEDPAGMPALKNSVPGDVRGMVVNPETGILYLLESQAQVITGYRPGESAPMERIRLEGMQGTHPNGLAWNPNNAHFYTADADGGRILEIDMDGHVAAVLDLAAEGLKVTGGMTFAPSGDGTDDPAEHSLYVVASNQDGGENQIVELTLVAPPQVLTGENEMNGLVRTINTYLWRPSSPDPSGISYWPAKGSYLVSDGEVEGYSGFTGNLYQMAISGTLQTTYLATFTSEPTGVAVNQINGEIYISDDDKRKVFVLNPGPDGQIQTGDDLITSFTTNNSIYQNTDPEGLGWGAGNLFIVDGTNSQVFVVSPGANRRFDGVPPSGDDELEVQFDTERWGVADPEGIDYNPQTSTLFIAGNNSHKVLIECTIRGSLVRQHDISAVPSINPAGVGIGPSSINPAVYSIYMTDRGADGGGTDTPDGRIFEITPYGQQTLGRRLFMPIIGFQK